MTRNAKVWLLMVSAVGIHVVDEAITGFLPFYNAHVVALRARFGFFPAPTFTFPVWLAGLAAAVLIGIVVTRFVNRGGKAIRIVCGVVALLMVANACGHLFGSLYAGRLLPGSCSSPLLLAMSTWMVLRAVGGDWSHRPAAAVGSA